MQLHHLYMNLLKDCMKCSSNSLVETPDEFLEHKVQGGDSAHFRLADLTALDVSSATVYWRALSHETVSSQRLPCASNQKFSRNPRERPVLFRASRVSIPGPRVLHKYGPSDGTTAG